MTFVAQNDRANNNVASSSATRAAPEDAWMQSIKDQPLHDSHQDNASIIVPSDFAALFELLRDELEFDVLLQALHACHKFMTSSTEAVALSNFVADDEGERMYVLCALLGHTDFAISVAASTVLVQLVHSPNLVAACDQSAKCCHGADSSYLDTVKANVESTKALRHLAANLVADSVGVEFVVRQIQSGLDQRSNEEGEKAATPCVLTALTLLAQLTEASRTLAESILPWLGLVCEETLELLTRPEMLAVVGCLAGCLAQDLPALSPDNVGVCFEIVHLLLSEQPPSNWLAPTWSLDNVVVMLCRWETQGTFSAKPTSTIQRLWGFVCKHVEQGHILQYVSPPELILLLQWYQHPRRDGIRPHHRAAPLTMQLIGFLPPRHMDRLVMWLQLAGEDLFTPMQSLVWSLLSWPNLSSESQAALVHSSCLADTIAFHDIAGGQCDRIVSWVRQLLDHGDDVFCSQFAGSNCSFRLLVQGLMESQDEIVLDDALTILSHVAKPRYYRPLQQAKILVALERVMAPPCPPQVQIKAVKCLGLLVGESYAMFHDMFVTTNLFPALLGYMKGDNVKVVRPACKVMYRLVRHPYLEGTPALATAVPVLTALLIASDSIVQSYAKTALLRLLSRSSYCLNEVHCVLANLQQSMDYCEGMALIEVLYDFQVTHQRYSVTKCIATGTACESNAKSQPQE
ncbi:hypothetical protein DYB37_011042 [Aphanomyces astaci]|uniref:Uncharacterized protein n=1 Tax=Aphanomyces astaci TaxID=112090 RepID=A0A418FHX9_APHAT|nr:hypothetical protein DYB37_011042 [Aphanomyces astaci]